MMTYKFLTRPAIVAALSIWMAAIATGAGAATSVTARAALHEGFGRVVFDWPATTAYRVDRDGSRLVITFEESFTVSFDSVKRVLNDYLSDIRLSDDGRTVEIELAAEFDFRDFAYDDKVIVDLMDPAEGVARITADAEAAPEDGVTPVTAEIDAAGDKPGASPVRVEMRIGSHPTFSRLVFDWPGAVDYQINTVGNRTVIRFDRAADIDLSKLNEDPLKLILSAEIETDGESTLVTLVTDPAARIRHFRADLRIVVDALLAPPGALAEETGAPEAMAVADVDSENHGMADAEVIEPAPIIEATGDVATDSAEPPEAPIDLAAETIPDLPSAGNETEEAVLDPQPAEQAPATTTAAATEPAVESDLEAAADEDGATATSVQLTLGPPAMVVSVKNDTNRSLVTFNSGKRTSSAAFLHGDHLWVIFEEPFSIDLAAARATKKTAYSMIEERNHDRATVLRFKLRDGFGATMRRRGVEWLLQITPSPEPPEAIEVRVTGDAATNQRVQLPLTRVGEHMQIRDPADRATIDVVPVMASGSGILRLRRLAQFDLLPTLQGIAVSGPGRIQVFTNLAGVEISSRAEPSDDSLQRDTVKQRARPVTTLFELVAWRRGDVSQFAANRFALHRAIATSTNRDLGKARLALVQFLFAHGYMAEAYGVLELLVEQEPRRAENISLRAMRGVMNLAMDRVEKAAGDLSAPVLDAYDDIALWRGVLAMNQGDLNGAAAQFGQAGDLWLELPSPLRERVGLMAAEAILENNDLTEAKAHLDILRSTSRNYDTLQRVKHLTGRLLLASGDDEEAVDLWRKVIAGSDRLARARAIFDDTLLMLENGNINLKEAIHEIEGLRYAWRSDGFELSVLRQLAALYIRDGQYRNGLVTMKLAVTHFSNYSATAAIASRMNELFAEIFLRDGAEDLAAIDALTLYFEFQELTPAGAEGDEVIQRLADRLVALDLLGRAAELLEHQLQYRLKGVEMARVGTRLAVIHLLNGTPEGAIKALKRSRLKDMPEALLTQRRHIRARALADLGRDEDAMKRLVGDNSSDAELLRADVSWRAGNWSEVAKATERLLELTPLKRPLSSFASRHLLRYAVALALADDEAGLKRLNRLYAAVMRGDTNQQAFDVITSDTGSRAASFRELPGAVARVASFEAFMSSYRERVKNNSLSAIN